MKNTTSPVGLITAGNLDALAMIGYFCWSRANDKHDQNSDYQRKTNNILTNLEYHNTPPQRVTGGSLSWRAEVGSTSS